MLGALLLAGLSSVPGAAASVRTLPTPVLHVTVNADGSLLATWSKAANENSIELVLDDNNHSSGQLTSVASLNSSGGCPRDQWCWPDQGTPLYCYDVLHVENTGSCAGIQDLGDSQTSETTGRLTIGATYWVQVLVKDNCVNVGNCAPGQIAAWSNLVKIDDKPTSKGGGSSAGGTAGSTSANVSGNAQLCPVDLQQPCNPANGKTPIARGETIQAVSGAVHLGVKEGSITLEPKAALQSAGEGRWTLLALPKKAPSSGQGNEYEGVAIFNGKAYNIVAIDAHIKPVGTATFKVDRTRKTDSTNKPLSSVTIVSVQKGQVSVQAGGKTQIVSAGYKTTVIGNGTTSKAPTQPTR